MRQSILALFADPEVAFLLLFAGLLLICIEFTLPGWVFPGALGGVVAMLSLHSFVRRGVGIAGVATALGIALLALQFWLPKPLVLAAFGTLLAGAGAVLGGIRLWVAVAVVVPFAIAFSALLAIGVRAKENKTSDVRAGIIQGRSHEQHGEKRSGGV